MAPSIAGATEEESPMYRDADAGEWWVDAVLATLTAALLAWFWWAPALPVDVLER